MRTMFLMPVVAAFFLLAFIVMPAAPIAAKFVYAVVFLPWLVFATNMLKLAWRRNWKSLLRWFAVSILISAVSILFVVISMKTGRTAEDRIHLDGWPATWLTGTYGCGIVMTFVLPFYRRRTQKTGGAKPPSTPPTP